MRRTSSRPLLAVCALIACFAATVTLVHGKQVQQTVLLQSFLKQPWRYITKFGLDIGQGGYAWQVRLLNLPAHNTLGRGHAELTGLIYLDDKWDYSDIEAIECKQKVQRAQVVDQIQVPLNGEPSEWKKGTLTQHVRRHVWFFAVSDCSGAISKLNLHGAKVEITLRMLNTDGGHFGCDERGFLWPYFILAVTGFVFLFLNVQKYVAFYRREQSNDWAHLIIIVALFLFCVSFVCEFAHQFAYSLNGRGITVLQLFAQILNIGGEFAITLFLILVSWGWTVNYTELEDLEVYIPLAALLGIVHMIIVGLGKLTDDSHGKYHQFDGWVGVVVYVIRVALYAYFVYGLRETFTKAREKVKEFARYLTYLGSLYFLSFPCIVLLSYAFDPYMRYSVVTLGCLAGQTTAIVWLSYICTSKSSPYYAASIKSRPLLPSEKWE